MQGYSPKIDACSHIAPAAAHIKALHRILPDERRLSGTPPLFDPDAGFRIMDRHNGLTAAPKEADRAVIDAEKKKIFEDNARSLLRLPI